MASGGRSAGGDGVGRLKDSIGGWVEVFHGMLVDGATWRSDVSVRRECSSACDGIAGDGKGVDGAGCVDMASEAKVGGGFAMDGGFDVAGSAA